MDPATFEADVLRPLKAAIPPVVDDSHREAISSRLRFANEHSQRQRMRTLFSEHNEVLRVLVDAPERYVSAIIDHRNDFTHFPPDATTRRQPGGPRDPERVRTYNSILRLLMESCFLKTMGFSPEEVRSFVASCETYRQESARIRKEQAL
jgi:hypothetical protein